MRIACGQVITKYQPEIVFHMAAQALVLESYKNPVATYATNVMGTAHLLESVRRVGGIRARRHNYLGQVLRKS